MDNIDTYIEECNQSKKNTEEKFTEFIDTLNNIKSNPELIFTNFFAKLDNPLYFIANFSSATLKDVMLPLIKGIPVFNSLDLKCEGYEEFGVFNNYTNLMDIDLKRKTFRSYCKEPNWKDYKYKPSESAERVYNIACALENFYNNRTLKNWHIFKRLNNPKKKFRGFIIGLTYLKHTNDCDEVIQRAKNNYKSEDEWKVDAQKRFDEKMRVWNESKDKIENIKTYLLKLDYEELPE